MRCLVPRLGVMSSAPKGKSCRSGEYRSWHAAAGWPGCARGGQTILSSRLALSALAAAAADTATAASAAMVATCGAAEAFGTGAVRPIAGGPWLVAVEAGWKETGMNDTGRMPLMLTLRLHFWPRRGKSYGRGVLNYPGNRLDHFDGTRPAKSSKQISEYSCCDAVHANWCKSADVETDVKIRRPDSRDPENAGSTRGQKVQTK
jgi:hypothetical protein